jgi:hypothetical protein
MATALTPYEVEAIMAQYSRLVDYAPNGSLRNRLQYEEDRIVLFQSEAWTTNFTERERAEVVQRFLTMVAHHDVAESLHNWSPAHAGYTVRIYRNSGSSYLEDKAQKINRWAETYFDARSHAVYVSATK